MGITLQRNFSHLRHHSIKSTLSITTNFCCCSNKKIKMGRIISILLLVVALMLFVDLGNAMVKDCGNCCDLDSINLNCNPACEEGSCIDDITCKNPSGKICWDREKVENI